MGCVWFLGGRNIASERILEVIEQVATRSRSVGHLDDPRPDRPTVRLAERVKVARQIRAGLPRRDVVLVGLRASADHHRAHGPSSRSTRPRSRSTVGSRSRPVAIEDRADVRQEPNAHGQGVRLVATNV
jgi:hypothetical protein